MAEPEVFSILHCLDKLTLISSIYVISGRPIKKAEDVKPGRTPDEDVEARGCQIAGGEVSIPL